MIKNTIIVAFFLVLLIGCTSSETIQEHCREGCLLGMEYKDPVEIEGRANVIKMLENTENCEEICLLYEAKLDK